MRMRLKQIRKTLDWSSKSKIGPKLSFFICLPLSVLLIGYRDGRKGEKRSYIKSFKSKISNIYFQNVITKCQRIMN